MSIKSPLAESIDIPEYPVHRIAFVRFAAHGDKIALVDAISGNKYSYKDILTVCPKVASGLVKIGVQKGDVVAICSYNSPEFAIMFWALLCTGATVTTVNPAYTKYELTHHLKDSGAKYIYTVKEFVPICKQTASDIPGIKHIIAANCEDCISFQDLCNDDGSKWSDLEKLEFSVRDDVAILPYSSGTTGLPKGVMITHFNLVACICQVSQSGLLDPKVIKEIQGGKVMKMLSVAPFYHVAGLVGTLVMRLHVGAQIVILSKFEPRLYLSLIEKYKINNLQLLPPIAIFMVTTPYLKDYDLSSVEQVTCGAAPLSKELEMEVKKKLNLSEMRQGYGMTETTVAAIASGYPIPTREGSVGKLVPATEAKIVDPETQKTLGANERGELYVRGPQVMKGYLNKPQATKETIDSENWLHTGDMAYYDNDQYIYIVDRLKELIKVKGFQVAPAELEAVLLTHPAVADAGVVGIPDKRAGELPRAFVVKKAAHSVTEKELQQYVSERTAVYKHLKGGIQFIQEIPRLQSGKILRKQLKELWTKSKL